MMTIDTMDYIMMTRFTEEELDEVLDACVEAYEGEVEHLIQVLDCVNIDESNVEVAIEWADEMYGIKTEKANEAKVNRYTKELEELKNRMAYLEKWLAKNN